MIPTQNLAKDQQRNWAFLMGNLALLTHIATPIVHISLDGRCSGDIDEELAQGVRYQ